MWRSKKFIIVAVIAAVVLVGGIGGVVLAQTENGGEDGSQPKTLLARVAEILDIDQQRLEDAFAQARSEMQAAAMEARLAKMVENGVIDETQAQELQEWLESRPEDLPFGPGLMAPGGGRPFGGPRGGFGGWFGPPPPE
jgi:outer membrane murein-binding lipoprotein Lpp